EFLRDGGTLEEEEPAAPAAEAAHAPPPAPEPTPSPEVVAEAVPEATPAPAAPEAFSPDSFAYAEQSAPPATQPGTAESKDAGLFNDSFLQELQGEGLLEAPSEPAADERVEESKGLMLLKEMQEELARPLTMSEIVLLLLRFTSEIMHRAIVFAIRKENIVGMGQYGIELKGANADIMIRKMKIPMSEPSIIKDAIDSKVQQLKPMESTPWNDYLIEKLGGVRPSQAFVTPVLVHDKVAVIIYGDTIPENGPIGDTSALEIFLAQASTALENIVDQKQSGLST
ncbi:MAG: hypothetical protein KAR06_10245, partial [Deltaproteobacteria bacterium]|nr:hypothetical protein [Deltaproteobacteria bacterium]